MTTSLSTWDGSIQWSWREQSAGPQPWDGATSLTEGDGVVYIFGHGLNAFDADTHRLVWSNDEAPNLDIGSVAIAHDQLIVAVGSHLGAYRRDSGALLWSETGQHRADGYFESFSGLVVLGDVVYVGRGSNGPRAFQIEARTPDTGAIKWVWPTDDTRLRFDISWRFCGAGETLYVPSLDTIWAIRASDGAQRWSHAYTSQFDAFLAISTNDTGI